MRVNGKKKCRRANYKNVFRVIFTNKPLGGKVRAVVRAVWGAGNQNFKKIIGPKKVFVLLPLIL